MAAAVVTPTPYLNPNEVRVVVVRFTPSTSYPAAGEPFTPALVGVKQILAVTATTGFGGQLWAFDPAQSTLRAFRNAAGAGNLAEVAAAQDLSAGGSFDVVVFARN